MNWISLGLGKRYWGYLLAVVMLSAINLLAMLLGGVEWSGELVAITAFALVWSVSEDEKEKNKK